MRDWRRDSASRGCSCGQGVGRVQEAGPSPGDGNRVQGRGPFQGPGRVRRQVQAQGVEPRPGDEADPGTRSVPGGGAGQETSPGSGGGAAAKGRGGSRRPTQAQGVEPRPGGKAGPGAGSVPGGGAASRRQGRVWGGASFRARGCFQVCVGEEGCLCPGPTPSPRPEAALQSSGSQDRLLEE